MEIILTKPLTKIERLAMIMKQIEEAETHGYGSINITIHNHQVTNSSLNKDVRFGNCNELSYIGY